MRSRSLMWLGVVAAVVIIAGYLWVQGSDGVPGANGTAESVGAEAILSAGSSERVAAMYRVGYRTPATDGTWGDWAVPGREPPDAIASDFKPLGGLYDSTNRSILQEHLDMVTGSSIGVVSVLWRGPESIDAPAINDMLDEAELRGLKVSFALEFPADGVPEMLLEDVGFLHETYGDHPALLRSSDPSPWVDQAGMVVTVVGLEALEQRGDVDMRAWTATLDAIHALEGGVIVIGVSRDPAWVGATHFDGLANGSIGGIEPQGYAWAADLPTGAWFVPLVSPGFSTVWTGDAGGTVDRDGGAYYDDQWTRATAAPRQPNLVLVYSFNDWFSGTQIEPAEPGMARQDGSPYGDYQPLPPGGYLDLTRAAVEEWAKP